MHILHVITTLNKGGAESHLVELCRGLAARGVEQTVAFLKGDGYWVPALRAMGVRTIDLGARRYADPGAIHGLIRAVDRWRPDLLHAHMPPAELFALVALRLGRTIPYVISKHVDRHPFYPGPGAAWLERKAAAPAASIICISQAVNNYFADAWPPALARKLVTVHYGLEPTADADSLEDDAAALRREWGVGPDETVFGIAARLVEQKSIDTLVTAFAALRSNTASPVRLAVVGQGPLEAELRALADRLGVGEQLIWAGFRTDIPVVMRAFDVFTLSSVYEGFGLVLLEAMEAATPIVASGVSAIPEIVVDGETGLLVPPRDPRRLCEAMHKMLDPQVRSAMGAAGRQRLTENFSTARMTQGTLAVYTAALDGAEPSRRSAAQAA